MARKLSDIEWATFLTDVDLGALNLPPWGGVVQWQNKNILVYVGPSGEVFTTDVTDSPALVANIPKTYDETQSVWWYHLPEEISKTVVADALAVGQALQAVTSAVGATGDRVLQGVSTSVGQAAGALTSPLLQNLMIPLIVVGCVALYFLWNEYA